ncbi:alpha-hydroxy-acid oxidizing protein, partial [Mycolicibacterium sphagni]|nr:alpha-hydroxy-acid oxidizing protein [Mycolicibacterium sphagni]
LNLHDLANFDCLPEVVAAAGELPVLFDSGVRSGADVIKALALGARALFKSLLHKLMTGEVSVDDFDLSALSSTDGSPA